MSDPKQWLEKLIQFLKKYKFVVLILLIGLVLLMIPDNNNKNEQPQSTDETNQDDYAELTEARLEAILSKVKGAGQVDVMLTLQRGSYTQYQTDIQTDQSQSEGSIQSGEDKKTVILSEGSAYDTLAVSTVEYPLFQGALIVCSGADSPSVKLNLIQAVAALTGLSSDHITVVKMN